LHFQGESSAKGVACAVNKHADAPGDDYQRHFEPECEGEDDHSMNLPITNPKKPTKNKNAHIPPPISEPVPNPKQQPGIDKPINSDEIIFTTLAGLPLPDCVFGGSF
jgi:hypothetical protein